MYPNITDDTLRKWLDKTNWLDMTRKHVIEYLEALNDAYGEIEELNISIEQISDHSMAKHEQLLESDDKISQLEQENATLREGLEYIAKNCPSHITENPKTIQPDGVKYPWIAKRTLMRTVVED